ncbi:E3 ubiquitin-protein ligase sina-like [Anthonomus grandis grandis]|uniref:E3 ubiquitin-protein ligase sina-like n=1 Tax=Anthonomus grandis grandis TaxID=2921223 RepID=UPI0021654CE2|nr:E3 ubiquitin-protein ligase sina-like [Anthonomus grandis grandis]
MEITIKNVKLCQKVAYPITNRDYHLEKAISKKFDCPVCMYPSSPPIMMCINSHIICFDCWKRCTRCPTCRAAKTLTRAFTMEKIHFLISFQCKWDGCSFAGSAYSTEIHEYLCEYFPLNCPLKTEHECTWTGTMGSVTEHLLKHHIDNVHLEPVGYFISKDFSRSNKKEYTVLFLVDGRLFKFYWSYNTFHSQKVQFGMVSLGNGNPLVVYNYTVTFSKRFPFTRSSKVKMMKSQVKKSFTDCSIVNRDPNLPATKIVNYEINYGNLVTYCTGGRNLFYQVAIEVSHLAKCKNPYRFYIC